MKLMSILLLFAPLLMIGCTSSSTSSSSAPAAAAEEDTINKNLDKLPPEDRKLAEEQKFCAVENENRLGKMGVPKKKVIHGEPVFLCCNSCMKEAEEHPDKVLAKARELRKENSKR